jgi:hypothetical protein
MTMTGSAAKTGDAARNESAQRLLIKFSIENLRFFNADRKITPTQPTISFVGLTIFARETLYLPGTAF